MQDQHPYLETHPEESCERITLERSFGGKKRGFAVFLICCALLIAAFAISTLWVQKGGENWFSGLGSFWKNEDGSGDTTGEGPDTPTTDAPPADETPSVLPEGATAILNMDLSYPSLGKGYLHNETDYTPDVEALLKLQVGGSATSGAPLVLILHTHTQESYLAAGTTYVEGTLGDAIYSADEQENILSVGEVLCKTLNQNGITAIHCEVMHDTPTMSGSYDRSAETVQRYLEMYPTIEYVIDLHRDAVTTSGGEFVRSLGKSGTESVAQVMAVVGTDGNGTAFDGGWEENLALALQLRELLNADGATVCRPVSLRNSSYNQELARYSLLLEIGTAANSPEEAKRAAVLVGEALSTLIQAR